MLIVCALKIFNMLIELNIVYTMSVTISADNASGTTTSEHLNYTNTGINRIQYTRILLSGFLVEDFSIIL